MVGGWQVVFLVQSRRALSSLFFSYYYMKSIKPGEHNIQNKQYHPLQNMAIQEQEQQTNNNIE